MVQVVIVNGAPTSGKSTLEDYCIDILGRDVASKLSTVDLVKKAAMVLGWDGSKTPHNRKFLSDLKYLADDWGDVSFNTVKTKCWELYRTQEIYDAADVAKHFLFVDVREPAQIQRFKEELGAVTVVVRNEKAEQMETSNSADAGVLDYHYDISVDNNGSLWDLKREAVALCGKLVKLT